MTAIHFDRYYRYEELTRILKALVISHPDLLRLESIGKSHEGRETWLVTASNSTNGPDTEKPAFWVEGNMHATELAASMAVLFLSIPLPPATGRMRTSPRPSIRALSTSCRA